MLQKQHVAHDEVTDAMYTCNNVSGESEKEISVSGSWFG